MSKRCSIVGAGASGLPSARWAVLYGFTPVIFEATDHIGGVWKFRKDATPSTMKSTIINTSKEMSAYSDFPPPDHFANYMHRTEMLDYLELYAKHFNIYDYIRFKHYVKQIRHANDYEKAGKWIVEYTDSDDKCKEEEFDCVLIATGYICIPNFESIKFPNQEEFQGRLIHASEYKEPTKEYEDKVNVVLGMGNSAVDIAVELSRIGKKTYLSTRRGAYIFSRFGPYGMPHDLAKTRWNTYYKSKIIPKSWEKQWTINKLQQKFDHEKYGLLPTEDIYAKPGILNDELPNRIISGTLQVKPNIREFTQTGIIWEDETKTEQPVHNVIFATGYLFNLDIVENGALIPVKDNYTDLYKYIYPVKLLDHCTLGVVGLVQPKGAILNTAEMQARLFFHVLSNKNKGINLLPEKEVMLKEVEDREKALQKNFKLHLLRFLADYVKYMDELADIIGCKPNPFDHIFTDFNLFYALMFKASAAYTYRLNGPHQWDGAQEAILNLDKRVIAPLMTRKPAITVSEQHEYRIIYYSCFIIFVGILLFYVLLK